MNRTVKRKGTKVAAAVLALAMSASLGTSALLASAATDGSRQIFASEYNSFEEVTEAGAELNIELASEGFVLLKNKDNALPLAADERSVTVLGESADSLATGGTGSGTQARPGPTGNTIVSANAATIFDALDAAGIEYNPSVKERYTTHVTPVQEVGGQWGGSTNPYDNAKYMNIVDAGGDSSFAGNEYVLAEDRLLAGAESEFAAYGDAAIVVISRSGAEGCDNLTNNVLGHSDPAEHYLELNDSEKELMAYAKLNFDKVIVLINSPSAMELGCLEDDDGISAVLWIGQPGWNGIMALGGVLTGEINPSGRTVDFYMRDFTTDPTWYNFGNYTQANYALTGEFGSEQLTVLMGTDPTGAGVSNTTERALDYTEGIYLGYKYYETVAVDLGAEGEAWYQANTCYPFGYGLSYTTFEQEIVSVEGDISDVDGKLTFTVQVTNTGSVPGKDVVQIYSTAPYFDGEIEKSAIELVGYAKTPTIGTAAGSNTATVEVEVYVEDLASFDYNDANYNDHYGYEIEAGLYTFSLRNNSHDVIDTYDMTLEEGITWDGDDDETTPNNIFSQTDNNWEPSNTNAYNWTVSGDNHYMTRGSVAYDANLTLIDFKEAVENKDTEMLGYLSWLLTEDNQFQDRVFYQLQNRLEPTSTYNDVDRDTDNVLTNTGETDYENLWTKTEEDIPEEWTQAASDQGRFDIGIEEMRGVAYDDAKWVTFLNQFTWEELVEMTMSGNYMTTGIENAGMSTVTDQDGPCQLKGANGNGFAWVCAPVVSSTWNNDLAYRQGALIGNENRWLEGVSGPNLGWYGPGVNVRRSPFGGRNFEYYSQDGVHGGTIAANVIKGATDMGCHVYMKHALLNEQETNRMSTVTFCNEQALREIYARQFELAIERGNANGLMTSFNLIGIDTSVSYTINVQLYTNEWGYDGLSVTDYYGADTAYHGWEGWSMVRGLVMPLGNCGPDGRGLEGTWDAANETVVIGEGDAAFESPTQWYWTRELAKRICYMYANSAGLEKGAIGYSDFGSFTAGEAIEEKALLDTEAQANLDAMFGDYGYELSYSNVPAGMKVSDEGILSGTPTYVGKGGIAVTATGLANAGDGKSLEYVTYNIVVEYNSVGEAAAEAGEMVTLADGTQIIRQNYVEGGAADATTFGKYIGMTFSATGLPEGMSIDPATGIISGSPAAPGTYHVSVSAECDEVIIAGSIVGINWYGTTKVNVDVAEYVLEVGGSPVLTVVVNAPTGASQTIYVPSDEAGTEEGLIAAINERLDIGNGWSIKDIPGYDASATQIVIGAEAENYNWPALCVIDNYLYIDGVQSAYLKGDAGADGADGAPGADGQDGAPGADGQDGTGIESVVIDADGHLIITLTDGSAPIDLGRVVGADGAAGAAGAPGADGADGQSVNAVVWGCIGGGAVLVGAAAVIAVVLILKRRDDK